MKVLQIRMAGKQSPVCVFLLSAAVFLIYSQTFRYGFVNYDDNKYIYEKAIDSIGQALRLNPNHEAAKQQLQLLEFAKN
jgi:hypothetical protein